MSLMRQMLLAHRSLDIAPRLSGRPRGRSVRGKRISARRLNCSKRGLMSAQLIDGKGVAQTIRGEIAERIKQTGVEPGLAVILVGSRKDSETYVRNKERACKEVGIQSFSSYLPETVSQDALIEIVQEFNADDRVHGILVQLPLPEHIDETKVLDSISFEKDVDGFHPMNVGLVALKNRSPQFVSCTPKACIELLEWYNVEMKGKRAVVIGRSNIVGMPMGLLLQERDATVTTVHSKTLNGEAISREADIVIAACGRAEMVTKDWLKPGCVVIDVGINAVEDPESKRGYRLVGDVKFADAVEVASLVTPVPGGVGPMTIAMLLQNTLTSALRKQNPESAGTALV